MSHFLDLWRKYITVTDGLTQKSNFLSRESCTDVQLSCHCAVSLICFMRDNYPEAKCHLELTGTDVVESYWSKNGQWVGNRHTYTFERINSLVFGKMANNLSSQTLTQLVNLYLDHPVMPVFPATPSQMASLSIGQWAGNVWTFRSQTRTRHHDF